MNSPYIITRRRFLQGISGAGAISALTTLEGLGLSQALAQTAGEDYKALVCIFLFGGNDANNLIIPRDTAAYNLYSTARGGTSGIAIAQNQLLPINPKSLTAGYGLHPSMTGLKTIWDAGKLAVMCNVGTLVEPLTKADYNSAQKAKPEQLFSHSDQQNQWQAAISNDASRTGWGGRLADVAGALNNSNFPMVTSITGTALFTAGNTPRVVAIPSSGSFGLSGFGSGAAAQARLAALNNLSNLNSANAFVTEADDILAQAIGASNTLNPIITATNTTITPIFANARNSIGNQLLQVAKLIEARATIGLKRQIFFVSLGGFDTHTNEIATHNTLYGQLGPAMQAFYDATVAMGIAD
ncbi:MAG: DUF1501 domain-containing protein, partial [Betaproteobacteria bacterium]|nr:DUF1501 domain-containing protein [Betaproteobacteria bacterium]